MTSKLVSILPDEMHGVAFGYGLRGVGKSTFFAFLDDPALIAFLDFDDGKGEKLHKDLSFGLYVDVLAATTKRVGPTYKPIDLYTTFDAIVRGLEQAKYTVLIIDNIKPLEEALKAEVKRNPDAYGIGKNKQGVSNAVSGSMGGANPGAASLISGYVSTMHGKGIKLVCGIAHVKAPWQGGGPVVNKWRPHGLDHWQTMSILTLCFVASGRTNPYPPAAIVFKEQLAQMRYNRETRKSEIKQRLPMRLPVADSASLYDYWEHPADLEHPKPGEVPTKAELDMFGEKFSAEQLGYMRLSAELELKRERESGSSGNGFIDLVPVDPLTPEQLDLARTIKADGKNYSQVAAILTEKFRAEITREQVMEALG